MSKSRRRNKPQNPPKYLANGYVNPAGQFFTQTAYDTLGRVNTITQPDQTVTVTNYKIHLLNSQPTSVTYTEDANGNTSEAWADAFGRLVMSQGAIGPAVTYTYDPADHLTSALYGSAQTQITYDIGGRKLTLDDPDMGLWNYSYDALGNLIRQTDARGQRICLYYDGLNRLTGKHYRTDDNCPASPTFNVSYGYDSGTNGIGQRTSMTDVSGSTSWTFDQRGRAISETRNLTGIGTFTTAWSYNSADLLAGMQYPENNSGGLSTQVASTYLPQMTLDTLGSYVTDTNYDAAGRITSRLLGSSGLRQDFAYTAWNAQYQGGKLDTIKAGTAPNYNNLQNLDYGYDKVGNILTILDVTNSNQKQCYTYDALNRLTRGTTTNDSDPAKQCGTTQLGNGNYDQSYTYDAATGNLGSKAGVGYTYGDTNHDHAVTRVDDDSPATSKTITIRAKKINTSGVTTHPIMNLYVDGQQVVSFSVSRTSYYNYSKTITISNNEQIDVVCSNCSSSIQLDIDYVTVGTQTVQAEGAATLLDLGTGTYAFDWQNVSKPTTGIIVEPAALRFVVGNNAFSGAYDANGNLIYRLVNGLATIMTYDAENRLTNVTGTAGATSTFVYDGDGNRVKSTINTTTTVFIGNHTEWEVGSGNLTRYYYAGASRVAMRKNNTVYYLLSDHLGSTSLTTDENGQNPVKQLYLPWGEVRYTDGTLQTKYTYTGQYSNVSDFGLMYYNARWYDSALGRFTSADTILPVAFQGVQAWDRYAYSSNNPINFTDPSGHWPIPSINFNSQQWAESVTNWALNLTGLSKMGYTTTDVQQVLSIVGVGADIIAECTDVIAVGVSATALIAGTALGVPEVGYATGELLASPLLLFGNFMATGATIASLGSDLLTGDTGLELSVDSNDSAMQINGELSIGTGSTVGLITTGIGWIPGLPSYASLVLQSVAVANDFCLGQKMGIFSATSYKIPINISVTAEGQNSYVPPYQTNSSNNQTLLPY